MYCGSIPEEDLEKDAEYLGITKEELIKSYLMKKESENIYVTNHHPCDFLKKDGDKSDVAVDLLMVAKYLERIADHAVNVCEWTEFSDTGAVGDVMIL